MSGFPQRQGVFIPQRATNGFNSGLTGIGNLQSFFQANQAPTGPQPTTSETLLANGYTPTSSGVFGPGFEKGGVSYFGSTADAAAAGIQQRSQPSSLQQAGSALMGDAAAQQAAANRQYARVNAAAQGVGDAASSYATQIKGGNANFEPLIKQQRDEFAADRATTLNEFQDRTAADAGAAASGIQRKYAQQKQSIEMGLNPDGTMMTPAQKRDALNNLNAQMGQEVNSTIQGIWSNYNNQRAQLRTQYSGLQDSLQSRVANLTTQQAAFNQANLLNAANLEMQGRTTQADFIRNNPESVVSTYALLASLANTSTAGGGAGRNLRGFTF